jgi:hypothetical protein
VAEKTTTTPDPTPPNPTNPTPAPETPTATPTTAVTETGQAGVQLNLPKAPASPPEVLALQPNRWEDAQSGPDPQIDSLMYVHMTTPDGRDVIVPISNVENYERKGFTRGADERIEDLVAYHAEKAKVQP